MAFAETDFNRINQPAARVGARDDAFPAAVHAALEAVALEAGVESGGSLEEALTRVPRAVDWPEPARAEGILLAAARKVARDEGVVLPGFAQLLARLSGPKDGGNAR